MTAPPRVCLACGASLDGRRRHARTCSRACRLRVHRALRARGAVSLNFVMESTDLDAIEQGGVYRIAIWKPDPKEKPKVRITLDKTDESVSESVSD